jgi:hypothetical protein
VGRSGLAYLDALEPEGRAYLDDMRWALAYAEETKVARNRLAFDVLNYAASA